MVDIYRAASAILFLFGCSEVNSTWLITSELANQRARKVLFTCVVYTKLLKTGSLDNAIREFSLAKLSWYMSHYTMI